MRARGRPITGLTTFSLSGGKREEGSHCSLAKGRERLQLDRTFYLPDPKSELVNKHKILLLFINVKKKKSICWVRPSKWNSIFTESALWAGSVYLLVTMSAWMCVVPSAWYCLVWIASTVRSGLYPPSSAPPSLTLSPPTPPLWFFFKLLIKKIYIDKIKKRNHPSNFFF